MNKRYRDYTKITLVILSIAFSLIVMSLNSKVKADEPSSYNIDIEIKESKEIEGRFEVSLTNNDKNNLINGYELNLPFKIDLLTSATLDGHNISKDLIVGNDYSDIRLSFFTSPIKPSQTGKIKITFNANQLLSTKYNVEYLFIPTINSNHSSNTNIIYKIKYPTNFNLPTFISPQENLVNNLTSLEINTNKNILIIWGDKLLLNIESSFNIENKSNNSINTLVALPYEDKRQSVYYKNISNEQNGLSDDLKNNFIYSLIEPSHTKEVKFNARINLASTITNDQYPDKYNFKFKDGDQSLEMLKILNTNLDSFEKLKQLDSYLITKMQPYSEENINLDMIPELWQKLQGNSKFNSFEFCYLMVTASEYLELPARISYGYIAIPEGTFNNATPHVWCEVKLKDKNILIDPYMESLLHIDYFGQNPTDRITFGIWHPNQKYNNMLGLLTSKNKTNVKISPIDDFTPNLKDLSFSLDLPIQAYSGEFYNGKINVKNSTNKILILKDILINGDSYLRQLKLNNLNITFLPQQNNTAPLNFLREKNFLYDGNEDIKVELIPQNSELNNITFSRIINFLPDKRLLLLILIIVILIILILLAMLYRISKPKKILIKPW